MRQRWILVIALAACSGEVAGSDGSIPGDGASGDGDGGAPPDVPGGVGEPAELAGITLYHNQVRAMVQTSPPLPALAWDPALAATAAAWVAMCVNQDGIPQILDHNPNRSDGHPYYVGENIFASSGTATAQQAVDLWAAERVNYNYAANSCAAGKTCGHYTQLVWRATVKVGCALGRCAGIMYPSTIVCDYGPGGNSGGRPY